MSLNNCVQLPGQEREVDMKACFKMMLIFLLLLGAAACNESGTDSTDGDMDTVESAEDFEASEQEQEAEAEEEINPLVPPRPLDTLGYERPQRAAAGVAPDNQEISDFTEKLGAFFTETGYFDWVWRVSHGLHEDYDPAMMDYKLWWQDVGMRKEGEKVVFYHNGRAENIAERTMKVLPNLIGGYMLTGNKRFADIATQYMKGMVALSLGFEFEREDPIVKYIQSRAIFNHNHSYTVDGRQMEVDYSGSCVPSAKWNVHIFEIPDNPTYGSIWVSNMRSKDDVPYVYQSMTMATRAYYETEDPALREAALLYIEYLRGFAQSIVDSDWYILTKYEDGVATHQYNIDEETKPEADCGSFVHWSKFFGEDAECNAQLGAALTAYGEERGKGDCDRGLAGLKFENIAFANHFFNYEIYVHFHIGALAAANLWQKNDIAESLMSGLAERFDTLMYDEEIKHRDDKDFNGALAGWLLVAATHGYPLTGDEAHHIMEWYGRSSDWYRQWPHWDPWSSMQDGETITDYKAPRTETLTGEDGSESKVGYIRLMEMPYIFEYCASPLRDREGVQVVDCDMISKLQISEMETNAE